MVILGALIKYTKWYWLIAGYNTASPEQQKQIDIGRLSKDISHGSFAVGGIMMIIGIVANAGFAAIGHIAMLVLPFAFVVYLVTRTQRYQVQAINGSSRKTAGMVLLFLGILFMGIVAMLMYSSQPARVTATSEYVQIDGIYSLQKKMKHIRDIKLLQDIPEIKWKTNGFNFGNIRKGNFTLQDLGNGKVYMQSQNPPFIFIKTDESFILINYTDAAETNKVFNSLHSKWINSR
jgi:preprotein translocase subunit YajC